MSTDGSKKVIIAAFLGNGLIAVTKFIAASFTGSSAMLSEAIHSLVDTGNQGLLLYGMKRAKRPADARHPFGYSMEIYFWAFVVAILIFAVGAGISIYEGIHKIQNPSAIKDVYINYIVLGFAIIFEACAWWVAYKEFNKRRGTQDYLTAVRHSKDPTVFTVLFEDTAAMLGLFVALIGIACSSIFDMPILDGVASVTIGIILAATAAFLAYETKALLIGEGVRPAMLKKIKELALCLESVVGINEVLTMHLGPNDVLLNISLDFVDNIDALEVEKTVSTLEKNIKKEFPDVKRIFIEIQSWEDHNKI